MILIYSLLALCVGFILDLLFGDPHWLWHPIRLIGAGIEKTEYILRAIFPKTKRGERVAGLLLVIVITVIVTVIPAVLLGVLYSLSPWAGIVCESIFCYQLLATKSLKDESMQVYKAQISGDLEKSRYAVSMIVGRDTNNLTVEGVTKAAVETVAENTSDGIIAPLLYMVIGGAPLGFFYKAVNTMDSMVGYKNERYRYFGTCAAKLDDVLNYIPARLSAGLMIVATLFTRFHTKNAWRIYRRDRYRHASPNSAHTEAVVAGALQIQLAGDAYYFGKLHKKETIGDAIRPVEIKDIKSANQLLYITAALGMLVLGSLKFLIIMYLVIVNLCK